MTRSLGATTPHHQSKCTEKIFQLSPAYKSKSWAPFSFRDKGKPRKVSSSIAMYQIPTRQPLFRPQKVSYFIEQTRAEQEQKENSWSLLETQMRTFGSAGNRTQVGTGL